VKAFMMESMDYESMTEKLKKEGFITTESKMFEKDWISPSINAGFVRMKCLKERTDALLKVIV